MHELACVCDGLSQAKVFLELNRTFSLNNKASNLTAFDLIWHLLNFFAPAFGIGVIAAGLTKLIWRRELRHRTWLKLSLVGVAACSVVAVLGLFVFGQDGKMLTYAGMALACAVTLQLLMR